MRRGFRKDANHSAIRKVFDSLGAAVLDTAQFGMSLDFIVGWRGQTFMVEVKDGMKCPSARKLTLDEIKLHAEMARQGVTVHVIESVDEAYELLGARTTA